MPGWILYKGMYSRMIGIVCRRFILHLQQKEKRNQHSTINQYDKQMDITKILHVRMIKRSTFQNYRFRWSNLNFKIASSDILNILQRMEENQLRKKTINY